MLRLSGAAFLGSLLLAGSTISAAIADTPPHKPTVNLPAEITSNKPIDVIAEQKSQKAYRLAHPTQEDIEFVKSQVKALLIDPYSAEFDQIAPCPSGNGWWYGSVNSKNRMGGYAGASPFMVKDKLVQIYDFTQANDRYQFRTDGPLCRGS